MMTTTKRQCDCPACEQSRHGLAITDRLNVPNMRVILTRDQHERIGQWYVQEQALLIRGKFAKDTHGSVAGDPQLVADMEASRRLGSALAAECEDHLAAHRAEADRRGRRVAASQTDSTEAALRLLKVSRATAAGTTSPQAEVDIDVAERGILEPGRRFAQMLVWEEATIDWYDRAVAELLRVLAAHGF